MESDELIQLRVASEPYAKSGQLDAFLEIWGRNILRIEMEPLDSQPLQVDLLLRSLPGFALASGSASPMRNRHTAELADNDDVVLVVFQGGFGEVNQYGRAATVEDGAAALTANGAPASFSILSPTRVINFRFSRELLRSRIANLDDLVARPIAKNNPVLGLLAGYAAVLDDQGELATAELRHAVSSHMYELAALVLGAKPEPNLADGFRAARLKAVKEDILRRLVQRGLSVSDIARAHQISERYLRKLFAAEETTFTDFVREARLARAHQMLTDPRYLYRPISEVAYASGFGDLSYFNRTFRSRYGATPSDTREAALKALKDRR
jgi:AraC-like DNA-binding protein